MCIYIICNVHIEFYFLLFILLNSLLFFLGKKLTSLKGMEILVGIINIQSEKQSSINVVGKKKKYDATMYVQRETKMAA